MSDLTTEDLQQALRVLEAIQRDRGELLKLDRDQQSDFLRVLGQVAHPGRAARRQLVRAHRRRRRQETDARKQRDESLLAETGIRKLGKNGFQTPSRRRLASAPPAPLSDNLLLPAASDSATLPADQFLGDLEEPRNCYICKQDFDRLHFFYDSMCPTCAVFNFEKRTQTANLSGRHALVTGGRVKIGFEACLKLLRAGASVWVTTRFPHDAAKRFAEQEDSAQWLDRLQVIGLDLRHIPSVEAFACNLLDNAPRLDFILNNACQTVRRPPAFFEHLMANERQLATNIPDAQHAVLATHRAASTKPSLPASTPGSQLADAGPLPSSEYSQLALLDDDLLKSAAFPAEVYDQDGQQIDLRKQNSWRLKLAEVSTVELLEVHLVNAVAPYILNARLRPLMEAVPTADKHIVNVSAMEGVFYRAFKRDTHPHTNMAKAALNMMTRTSAADYVRSGIHMNSVDTGWITDEDPLDIAQRKLDERGFRTPLDTIDAAARICDPIFSGLNTQEHLWGKFLKDYRVSNW